MGLRLKRLLSDIMSNREAVDALNQSLISVNRIPGQANQLITKFDVVEFNGKVIQQALPRIYIAYYKPRGIESTLNKSIQNNLSEALKIEEPVFPLGRLDKESEGLMILTNDGSIYNSIVNSGSGKEKEYIVRLNSDITDNELLALSAGIEILGKMTQNCFVERIDSTEFRIILKQGLNRQIRRMCYKIGHEVILLKRIRIHNVGVGDLQPGEYRYLDGIDLS